MKKNEFVPTKESLLARMRQERYSPGVLEKTNWVLNHFKHYCDKQELEEISISAASEFVPDCFGFDMFRPAIHLQATLRDITPKGTTNPTALTYHNAFCRSFMNSAFMSRTADTRDAPV